jgi:hypothetical protein
MPPETVTVVLLSSRAAGRVKFRTTRRLTCDTSVAEPLTSSIRSPLRNVVSPSRAGTIVGDIRTGTGAPAVTRASRAMDSNASRARRGTSRSAWAASGGASRGTSPSSMTPFATAHPRPLWRWAGQAR